MVRTNRSMLPHLFLAGALVLMALTGTACTENSDQEEATVEQTVEQAVGTAVETLNTADAELVAKAATIADAIEAAPQTATAVLAEAGMSAKEFEALIYKISENEQLAAAYAAARTKN